MISSFSQQYHGPLRFGWSRSKESDGYGVGSLHRTELCPHMHACVCVRHVAPLLLSPLPRRAPPVICGSTSGRSGGDPNREVTSATGRREVDSVSHHDFACCSAAHASRDTLQATVPPTPTHLPSGYGVAGARCGTSGVLHARWPRPVSVWSRAPDRTPTGPCHE